MILSGAYNYVNVLDKAADAGWKRNDVLANNIANADTPGYKRKDVQFETYLIGAIGGSRRALAIVWMETMLILLQRMLNWRRIRFVITH